MLRHSDTSPNWYPPSRLLVSAAQEAHDAAPLVLHDGVSGAAAGGATAPAVEFLNVSFGYHENQPILRDFSMKVLPGQTVAVVGPSGCGKSTLLRLMYRFYDVEDGAVSVHGQDVRGLQLDSLRQAVGIVPQDTVLFNDTIFNNIAYGALGGVASEERVHEVGRLSALEQTVGRMPEGYDTLVGERGLKLSGGEKQRVALARAMLKDPPFLLCDEATSALDSETECSVMTALRTMASGERTTRVPPSGPPGAAS